MKGFLMMLRAMGVQMPEEKIPELEKLIVQLPEMCASSYRMIEHFEKRTQRMELMLEELCQKARQS